MVSMPSSAGVHSAASSSIRPLRRGGRSLVQTLVPYASLLKPRILVLLLFVSLATAYLASKGNPSPVAAAVLLITGAMAAGGAGVLNHYLERDLDSRMERTRHRALVEQTIRQPRIALGFGILLILSAVAAALPWSPWLAFFLFAGAFVYVVVYTLWLKRRTAWNVVLGGLAGSCAILSGWAAIGAWWKPEPLLLALLLFLWTPPHFWSLAILRLEDYRGAGVPMLPVVAGPRAAAWWSLLHVLLIVGVSLALFRVASFGSLYLGVALVGGIFFIVTSALLVSRPDGRRARLQFRTANFYLAALFLSLILDLCLR